MRLDFKDIRDKDFLDSYTNVIKRYGKKAPYIKRDDLLLETILSPAKRFYVSEEQALRTISKILKGQSVVFKNILKKKMYDEILRRVMEKWDRDKEPLIYLLCRIINEPAPRFYINLKSARILYYKLLTHKK